jgi:type II secretory pathway predicted ATPase ExeA
MYLSHYNLIQKPFEITTDPKFIWLGKKHTEALATLEYGIQESKGFLLITGDVGIGAIDNLLTNKYEVKNNLKINQFKLHNSSFVL